MRRSLERYKHRWEDNIKMALTITAVGFELDSLG
jgi:hypothetical protein